MENESIVYHVDKVATSFGNILIQGWAIDREGKNDIHVEDARGERLVIYTERLVRQDVNQIYQMKPEYEAGFHVVVDMGNITTRKILLVFENDREKKSYEVDLHKNRLQNRLRRTFLKDETIPMDYDEWVRQKAPRGKAWLDQRRAHFSWEPLFSVVIPLYNTPIPFLKKIVDSVLYQTYRKVELCLADGSTNDEAEKYVKSRYRKEKRIKYMRLRENRGISINTNRAISMATGDFIVFADHDDALTKDAFYEMAKALNQDPKIEILYSDEDKVNKTDTNYFGPHLKTEFDMDLLRCNNYICHIFAVKREVLDRVGLLRKEYDGAQDYDFVLRCCEQSNHICHIPKVLYHWRVHPQSTAGNPQSKLYAFEAGRRAVEDHYRRTGVEATVESTDMLGRYRTRRAVLGQPLVSVLIPNMDHVEELTTCLDSLFSKTSYANYEVLIIENNSKEPETFAYYEKLKEEHSNLRVIRWGKAFHYAAMHNEAVMEARGEYLLFLNNDVEIRNGDWMMEMLSHCQRDEVGAVGAKLYYPDGTIQHAGVVIGFGGVAGHLFAGTAGDQEGYMAALVSVRQVSAVTAACMMTKKSLYGQVGGMDESFQVAYNDVDYCLKLRTLGKEVLFTPYAELTHFESKSRGLEDTPEKKRRLMREAKHFATKWPDILKNGDPFFNQNLFEIVPEYRNMKYDDTFWDRWSEQG